MAQFNADPQGKSTGQNTKLLLMKVPANTALAYILVQHDLGFIPSWARVTPLSQDDTGTAVLNTGSLEPAIDIAASGATNGLVWLNPGGAQDLTTHMYVAWANADLTYDAWFLLEVGRTHSRTK